MAAAKVAFQGEFQNNLKGKFLDNLLYYFIGNLVNNFRDNLSGCCQAIFRQLSRSHHILSSGSRKTIKFVIHCADYEIERLVSYKD